jgi:hypothetical protein
VPSHTPDCVWRIARREAMLGVVGADGAPPDILCIDEVGRSSVVRRIDTGPAAPRRGSATLEEM